MSAFVAADAVERGTQDALFAMDQTIRDIRAEIAHMQDSLQRLETARQKLAGLYGESRHQLQQERDRARAESITASRRGGAPNFQVGSEGGCYG